MDHIHFFAFLCEGFAAVAGFRYFKKRPKDVASNYFSYFLLFTFLVETVGHIPIIIYRHESLHFLKDTWLGQNYWLFNPYLIISFLVFINYFKWNLSNKKSIKILNIISVFFFFTAVGNLVFSGVLFETFSSYTYITGTLFLFISVVLYYHEILTSDKVLYIKQEVSFYISIAALLYYLCTTPFFIYFKYYSLSISPEFVEVYTVVSLTANIFMYTCFALGFIVCSRKNNSYLSFIL